VLLCLASVCLRAQSPVQAYIDAFLRDAASFDVRERAVEGAAKPGAIHHLRGHVFVPDGSLEAIVKRVRDYDTHADLFNTTLRTAALCGKETDDVFVFRYWATPYRDSISETRATHRKLDDKHYVVTSSTLSFGGPGDLPDRKNICKGTLPGVFYMKQLHAVWRYEQKLDGVQIEAEAVAELSGFALVRATAKRVLAQIMTQSLDSYREKFHSKP
jgi:hypothetical protein